MPGFLMKLDIENFFAYFRNHLSFLYELEVPLSSQIPLGVNINNIRILLACTYIEALAKGYYRSKDIYMGDRDARVRFIKFIEEFSNFEHTYSTISLVRLLEYLEKPENRDEFADFITYMHDSYSYISTPLSGPSASSEPNVDEFREQLRINSLTKRFQTVISQLDKYTYSSILWNDCRSGLVHEARVRQGGPDFGVYDEPHYISVQGTHTPYFLIPWRFILITLENCLEGFEGYCTAEQINPYSLYDLK